MSDRNLFVLVIGEQERARIRALRFSAESRPMTFDELVDISVNQRDPDDFNRHRMLRIQDWTLCFTTEIQAKGVKCRHLSIASCMGEGSAPPPAVIDLFAKEFGFINTTGVTMDSDGFLDGKPNLIIYTERTPDNRLAVNIVEPMNGDMDLLRADFDV